MKAFIPFGRRTALAVAAALASLFPQAAMACACGCDVFAVGAGAGTLMPSDNNGRLDVEYDFMDQNQNWSGSTRSPAANNADKRIRTSFLTLGGEWRIARDWAVMAEVPYWDREFKTDPGGGVKTFRHAAFGDVRLMAAFTGLSSDRSTGLTLGIKLPTGDHSYSGFDRDTEIGAGAVDILTGGYHTGHLGPGETWGWFVQGLWDRPITSTGGYRPGQEFDAALGVAYSSLPVAGGKIAITPIAELIGSARAADQGPAANPGDSGYRRVIIAPGLEARAGKFRVFGEVEFPIAQGYNGNQLAAAHLFKFTVSRDF